MAFISVKILHQKNKNNNKNMRKSSKKKNKQKYEKICGFLFDVTAVLILTLTIKNY
jgi:hypothetical protein